MPRKPKTHQLDLFSTPHDAEVAQMPPWQAKLMVRLILDHSNGERAVRRKEMRHDA